MTSQTILTATDLLDLLRACAGDEVPAAPGTDVYQVPLEELGYDSLGRLELAAQLQQRYGVSIADESISGTDVTLLGILDEVNDQLMPTAA